MTESERITYLINVLEGGNAARFGEKIGISKSMISRIKNGHKGFRLHVNKILEVYPRIERAWLETGEGYPGDLTVESVKAHYMEKIRLNERIIDNLIRRIEQLEGKAENV